MNKFSLLFVLFNAAVLGWSNASDFSCTPNETYKISCNTCTCSSDGKTAICSQLACVSDVESETLSTESATTEGSLEHNESNNHVCTPNDIKMQDCNRCRCAANGIGWFCTRRACPPKELRKRAVQSPLFNCQPGQTWNDGCNNCFCTENGMAACTMMLCFGQNQNLRHKRQSPAEDKCIPGTSWKNDCNTCFCSDTGIAACTLKGCIRSSVHVPRQPPTYAPVAAQSQVVTRRTVTFREYDDPSFTCEPSEFFKLECNNCKCGPDGKSAVRCTKKRCFDGE